MAVAAVPHLAAQFNAANKARMQNGAASVAPRTMHRAAMLMPTEENDAMTREDAIALVTKLVATNRPEQEHECSEMMDRLEMCFPNADIIELIYQDMRNLTPEQVVEEAYQREAEHARTTGAG